MIKRDLEEIIYGSLNSELKQVLLIFLNENPQLLRDIIENVTKKAGNHFNLRKMRSTALSIFEKGPCSYLVDTKKLHDKERYGAQSKYYLNEQGEKISILAKFLLIEIHNLSKKYKKNFSSYDLFGSSSSKRKRTACVERKNIIKTINGGADFISNLSKKTKLRNLDCHMAILKKAGIVEYESLSIGEEKGGDEIIALDKNGEMMINSGNRIKTIILKKDILNLLYKKKETSFDKLFRTLKKRWKGKRLADKNLKSKLEYYLKTFKNQGLINSVHLTKYGLEITEKGKNFEKNMRLFGKNDYIVDFRKKMLDILHKDKEISTMSLLKKLNENYNKKYNKKLSAIEGMLYYALQIFKENDIIKSKKFPSTARSYIKLTDAGREYAEKIISRLEAAIDEICEGKNTMLRKLEIETRKYQAEKIYEIIADRLFIYSCNNIGTKRLPPGEKKEVVFDYILKHPRGVRPRDLKKMFIICPQRILEQLIREKRIKKKRIGKMSLYFAR